MSLLALLLSLAHAAPLASIRDLDPEVLVAMALRGPSVRQQEALAAAAAGRTGVARLSPLDGMVVGVGTDPEAETFALEPKAYLSVNVGSVAALPGRVRAARQDQVAQEARAELERAEVRVQVLTLIEAIALEEARVAARERTVVAFDALAAAADRELAQGLRSVYEVADLEERRALAAEAAARAQSDLRVARVRLEGLIGAPLASVAP